MSNPRHMYYGDPTKLDLSKMREAASDLSKGDYRNDPVHVVIHHHKKEEECMNKTHEAFPAGNPA